MRKAPTHAAVAVLLLAITTAMTSASAAAQTQVADEWCFARTLGNDAGDASRADIAEMTIATICGSNPGWLVYVDFGSTTAREDATSPDSLLEIRLFNDGVDGCPEYLGLHIDNGLMFLEALCDEAFSDYAYVYYQDEYAIIDLPADMLQYAPAIGVQVRVTPDYWINGEVPTDEFPNGRSYMSSRSGIICPQVNVNDSLGAADGYLMLGEDGAVYAFGGATSDFGHGCAHILWPDERAVDIAVDPNDPYYYWILTDRGRVFSNLSIELAPSPNLFPDESFTTISLTPDARGFWLFTSRGRALPSGTADFYGDMLDVPLNGGVVDAISTPTGRGYWMVGSDGGIFAFGDAQFHGSMGGTPLNGRIVGLSPTPSNLGYWLVAEDGGIFAFGDADFYGSMGGTSLNQPVRGMVPYGSGYLMVASDGGIFAFGDTQFYGSLGATPPAVPIATVAAVSWPSDLRGNEVRYRLPLAASHRLAIDRDGR